MHRSSRLLLCCILGLSQLATPASDAGEEVIPLHHVERVRNNPTSRNAAWLSLQFAAEEPFRFLVEERMTQRDHAEGVQLAWDHDADATTPAERFVVPRGVIEVRAALLAARAFWRDVCARAGFKPRFAGRDPMTIWMPDEVDGEGRHAIAKYGLHAMIFFVDHLDAGTAVHEYFHMVQGALWAKGDAKKYDARVNERVVRFLLEATATWAQDVPIRVPVAPGEVFEPDRDNSYLSAVGQIWRLNDFSLLRRPANRSAPQGMDGYIEALFVKYLAEQLAGGKDPGNHARVLTWFARCMHDDLSETTLVRKTGDILPASFGATWQARWRSFHKAFRMSNVVQKGGAATEHTSLLGYFDDAFQSLEGKPSGYRLDVDGLMYPVYLGPHGIHRGAYAEQPQVLKIEPAQDDEERIRRLTEILQHETIAPQGCRTRLIAFAKPYPDAKPFERTAYVMVEADGPADAYLLEQRTHDEDHRARATASFRWNQDLVLPAEASPRRSVVKVSLQPAVGERCYLWCGLVNQDLEDRWVEARWTYVNLPRLVPYLRLDEYGRTSETVKLVGGSAFERAPREGMRNGDDFVLTFDTIAPLHFGKAKREPVPPRELMLEAELIGADGAPVGLAGPLRFDALPLGDMEEDGRVRYTVSGRLAENNPVAGACRLRLRVESLLRLGEADEQLDESFAFTIARGPRVARVRATSGDRLAYDSDAPAPKPRCEELRRRPRARRRGDVHRGDGPRDRRGGRRWCGAA